MVQPSPFNAIARDLARRLIDLEGGGGANDPVSEHAAKACDRVYRDLSRWIGRDGCHALFTRALAQARSDHSLLDQVQLRPRSDRYLEVVPTAIMEYGNTAVNSALESMLVALIELLARLIGDDMATKLIEQTSADLQSPDPNRLSSEEEA
jgi:hypothetical protein